MKKAKRNAILGLIIFLLIAFGATYAVIYGLGAEQVGLAKDIPLGLDLQGGVSVTYEIQEDNASDEDINATIDKLQRRVDTYSPDAEVYRQGNKRITVEIPLDTSKYDPNEILDMLGRPGKLEFLDTTNYNLFAQFVEGVCHTDAGRGLAFAGGCRVDRRNKDQFAVRTVLQGLQIFLGQFRLIPAVKLEVIGIDPDPGCYLCNRLHH